MLKLEHRSLLTLLFDLFIAQQQRRSMQVFEINFEILFFEILGRCGCCLLPVVNLFNWILIRKFFVLVSKCFVVRPEFLKFLKTTRTLPDDCVFGRRSDASTRTS